MSFLRKIFGAKVNYRELIEQGAKVVDVRSRGEFSQGHFQGAINIPLDELPSKTGTLNPSDTIVVCCRSGIRSSSAKRMLDGKGFKNVVNGGAWTSLN